MARLASGVGATALAAVATLLGFSALSASARRRPLRASPGCVDEEDAPCCVSSGGAETTSGAASSVSALKSAAGGLAAAVDGVAASAAAFRPVPPGFASPETGPEIGPETGPETSPETSTDSPCDVAPEAAAFGVTAAADGVAAPETGAPVAASAGFAASGASAAPPVPAVAPSCASKSENAAARLICPPPVFDASRPAPVPDGEAAESNNEARSSDMAERKHITEPTLRLMRRMGLRGRQRILRIRSSVGLQAPGHSLNICI